MIIPGQQRKIGSKGGNYALAALFGLIFLLGIWSVLSPEPTVVDDGDSPANSPSSYGGYLLRVMLITLALIAVLIVVARVAKKQNMLAQTTDLKMRILGKRYISPKQYFMKVMIDDRYLLLGVSEQSINLITELAEPGELPDEEPVLEKQGFAAFLSRSQSQFGQGSRVEE